MNGHIAQRLQEIGALEDGWLNGEGQSIPPEGIALLKSELPNLIEHRGLPEPHLYPTMAGGVQAEWALGPWEVSAAFSFGQLPYQVELLAVDTSRSEERWLGRDLFLVSEESRAALVAFVLQFAEGGGS